MIDPTRLLGGLVRGSLGRGLSRNAGMALGMGAVGIAIAAFEHLSQQRQATPAGAATQQPPPLPSEQPGPRHLGPSSGPPPLPHQPPAVADAGADQSDALVLIRAMVAAAWADGALDESERDAIVRRLATAGLDDAEQALASHELEHPAGLEEVVAMVRSRELAEQVYTVSLLAIRVDTGAERAYLQRLASGLALQPDTVARIHRLVGVAV